MQVISSGSDPDTWHSSRHVYQTKTCVTFFRPPFLTPLTPLHSYTTDGFTTAGSFFRSYLSSAGGQVRAGRFMENIQHSPDTFFFPKLPLYFKKKKSPSLPAPAPTSTSCSFCSVSVREYSATASRFPSAPAAFRARRGSCSP